jgi:mannitol/fructose-specific phosphotransferase system IIA component (Ntr-type)
MQLKDYIPPENIIADLKSEKKIGIIEEMLERMSHLGLIKDYETALNDTLTRESYLSTGLENGLAIPHAKTDAIEQLSMTFGRSLSGVDFQSLDGKPTYLIFLVLSPKDVSGPHIQALAVISRNLKDAQIRERIRAAKSAEEIAEIISEFK